MNADTMGSVFNGTHATTEVDAAYHLTIHHDIATNHLACLRGTQVLNQ
jgi:hypothetical protein